jgi:hypothetical protein
MSRNLVAPTLGRLEPSQVVRPFLQLVFAGSAIAPVEDASVIWRQSTNTNVAILCVLRLFFINKETSIWH